MINVSLKQNGNTAVAIVIVLAVAIIGLLGFLFWYNFINKQQAVTKPESSMTANKEPNQIQENSSKIDTSIHEVDIKMQSTAEISRLPSYTPASFKSYISRLLEKDTASNGMVDCGTVVLQYQISKISQVNIEGGTVPVNKDGQTCPGGAPAIWALTPSGTWDQETLNGPVCRSKNGGLIYEEFEPECYTDTNTSSLVKNPNGSVKSLGQ